MASYIEGQSWGTWASEEGDEVTCFINGLTASLGTLHHPKVTKEPAGHSAHSLWLHGWTL